LFVAVVGLSSCNDSPLSPAEAGAIQMSETAMLASILSKLDSISAKLAEQEATFAARIDSLELAVTGGVPGGTVNAAAQVDSILALASFIATDMTSGGWELCGGGAIGLEVMLEFAAEAEGQAVGSLGAWAGTGGFAGAEVKAKAALKGGPVLDFQGGIEGCMPVFGDTPPVRPAPTGPARSPVLDQLHASLGTLSSQLNLSPETMSTAFTGIGSAIQSPGSLQLSSVASSLPLPPALASLASNPMATVGAQVQSLAAQALANLCGGINWGPAVSAIITQACAVGSIDINAFATVTNIVPGIQNTMANVCNRINMIGTRRLIISSWDITLPLGIGTVNVFPGYNQLLFPNYTNPCV
jgi:hypothetical protein